MSGGIEISRDLADRLYRNLASGEEAYQAQKELRSLIAAPAVERKPPIAYMRNEGTPDNLVKCTFTCPGAFGVYREQPAPVAVVLPRYTCIGKGGEYELLGNAIGAGTLKDMSAIPVYRDTTTGQLFVRTPLDFSTRMECLNKVKELN